MTNLVASQNQKQTEISGSYTREQLALIKRTIAHDATDDELKMFLYHCSKNGLDPLSKQIYFQKRGGKPVFITSIDGFRLIAARTGEHAGTEDAVFDDETNPKKATITVYRMVQGQRVPFTASARWSEYCPTPPSDRMWKKMPCTMLAKCAESLALRKAFPNELGALYSNEEMARSGADENKPAIHNVVIRPSKDYVISFGKHKDKSPIEVPTDELGEEFNRVKKAVKERGGEMSAQVEEYLVNVEHVLLNPVVHEQSAPVIVLKESEVKEVQENTDERLK